MLIPVVCFAGTVIYYFGLAEIVEDLLPVEHRAALFATVSFIVAAVGSSIQSALVSALRDEASTNAIESIARPSVIGLSASAFTATALVWLAVRENI